MVMKIATNIKSTDDIKCIVRALQTHMRDFAETYTSDEYVTIEEKLEHTINHYGLMMHKCRITSQADSGEVESISVDIGGYCMDAIEGNIVHAIHGTLDTDGFIHVYLQLVSTCFDDYHEYDYDAFTVFEESSDATKATEMALAQKADYLLEHGIVSESELKLVCAINGTSDETLDKLLYARTGYQDFAQIIEEQ